MHETTLSKATITHCSFRGADLSIAYFDSAQIQGVDFDDARLERSDWANATVREVSFCSTSLIDATMTNGTFINCVFRGSDLRRLKTVLDLATAFGARFERCDFRGARIDGWRLRDTSFVNCKLGDTIGTPTLEGAIEVVAADLSANGDASILADTSEVTALWRGR